MRARGLRYAIIDRRVGQNSSAQMGQNSLSLPYVSALQGRITRRPRFLLRLHLD
jgi:hypothetical protein